MKDKVAYSKVLGCANKFLIMDLGRYLDKGKYMWFKKIKVLQILHVFNDK
jgi:hypothetical protein